MGAGRHTISHGGPVRVDQIVKYNKVRIADDDLDVIFLTNAFSDHTGDPMSLLLLIFHNKDSLDFTILPYLRRDLLVSMAVRSIVGACGSLCCHRSICGHFRM